MAAVPLAFLLALPAVPDDAAKQFLAEWERRTDPVREFYRSATIEARVTEDRFKPKLRTVTDIAYRGAGDRFRVDSVFVSGKGRKPGDATCSVAAGGRSFYVRRE